MKKVWVASGIVAFIALVAVISTAFMSDDPSENYGFSVDYRGLPESFANFELFSEVEAERVNDLMANLHGKDVELDQAFILEYGSRGGAQAVVWISETNIDGKPEELLEAKYELVTTDQLLTDFGEKNFSDQTVFHGIDNNGVDNYFFVSENRFLLIQTYDDNREAFMRNAVRVF